jgi:hypothetical protein
MNVVGRISAILGIVATGFACSGISPDIENVGQSEARLTGPSVDLISPSTCTLRFGRLSKCAIPPQTVELVAFDSAVPLRTRVVASRAGDCFTQNTMGITVGAEGADDVQFDYLRQPSVTLRRRDSGLIANIRVKDGSPWTSQAFFDQGCRASVMIYANEPDVSSKAEAQAIVDAIARELAEKTATRDRLQELTLYHRAFQFLKSIAENFRVELTNETVQALRDSAAASVGSISKLASACDPSLDDADRQNLLVLYMSLPQLGSASDWRNADGSPKTLAQFVGPSNQAVFETVQRLAAKHETDGGSTFDADYTAAVTAALRLQEKLARAKAQLQDWLTP